MSEKKFDDPVMQFHYEQRELARQDRARSALEELIAETEAKMMDLPLPPKDGLEGVKALGAHLATNEKPHTPAPAVLLRFIRLHGRAPNREELEELARSR